MKKLRSGFTLVEVLVVLAIMGLMMGIMVVSMGTTTTSKLKKVASHINALSQYLYNESAVKKEYHRLVIDFSENRYWVESSSKPFQISDTALGEEKQEDRKEKDQKEEMLADEGASFQEKQDSLSKAQDLPSGILFKNVWVEHLGQTVHEGKVAIYFFPNGWVEKAVIQLGDEEGSLIYSLETLSISGKIKVHPEAYELKEE